MICNCRIEKVKNMNFKNITIMCNCGAEMRCHTLKNTMREIERVYCCYKCDTKITAIKTKNTT